MVFHSVTILLVTETYHQYVGNLINILIVEDVLFCEIYCMDSVIFDKHFSGRYLCKIPLFYLTLDYCLQSRSNRDTDYANGHCNTLNPWRIFKRRGHLRNIKSHKFASSMLKF